MSDQKKTLGAPFTEFFDSVMVDMRARRKQRETDAIKRTMASEERILELQERVERGVGAKRFVEGDFWLDHFEPFLRSEAVLKPATAKDGVFDLARSFVTYLVGSGKVLVLGKVIATLDEWQEQGVEASKILELEAEKKRRVSA